ncbi:MFS transporter [Kitasatospora phosalacinea]|uniref:MFS transporter n=1 Tax=Kitasatospora phosalacinea TaxID=2065 RepID=A0ABW6GMH2_9ACTN
MQHERASHWKALTAGGVQGRILLASLVNSIGTGIYLGTAVLFFTRFEHLAASTVASAMSTGALLALLTTAPSALVAERIGAQRLLVLVHLTRAVGYGAVGYLHSAAAFAAVMVCMVVLDRAAPPLMQSIIADAFPRERRATVLALRQSMTITGISVGTALAALAVQSGSTVFFRALLTANGVSFVAAALVVRSLPVRPDLRPRAKAGPFSSLREWPRPQYLLLTLGSALLMLYEPLLFIGVPLWLGEHTRAPQALIGVSICVYTVSSALFQPGIGRRIVDLRTTRTWLLRGLAALLVSCGLFAAATLTGPVAATLCLLAAAVVHAFGGSSQSLALWFSSMELAEEERRERHLAVYSLSGTVQRVVAPLVAVWLVGALPRGGWLLAAAVFAAVTLMCHAILARHRSPVAPVPAVEAVR